MLYKREIYYMTITQFCRNSKEHFLSLVLSVFCATGAITVYDRSNVAIEIVYVYI